MPEWNESERRLLLELELYRARLAHSQAELDRYRAEHEAKRPLVEAVMRFADLAVRSLLILNGGAALAILTYAANATKTGSTYGEELASLVWYFGVGAFLSAATAGLAYVAQVCFSELSSEGNLNNRWGHRVRVVALVVGIASLAAFGWGMLQASGKLASVQSQSTAAPAAKSTPQLPMPPLPETKK